jgi:sugar O-acyltransferase (sialic acid O-acetyltransferase NeuD family)
MDEIAIYGGGGFGMEVAAMIEQINNACLQWKLVGFFDDGLTPGRFVNDYPVLGGIDELNRWPSTMALALAIGIPKTKKQVFNRIANPNISYPVLIHPSVIIGSPKYVELGEGAIVCAGSILTTNIRIGKHVLINLACTVGHQSKIGDFSCLMPTCNISGEVEIGECVFWGTGSKIINRKKVGNNVTIGAGAVVINDLADDVTAVGVPAKVVERPSRQPQAGKAARKWRRS